MQSTVCVESGIKKRLDNLQDEIKLLADNIILLQDKFINMQKIMLTVLNASSRGKIN